MLGSERWGKFEITTEIIKTNPDVVRSIMGEVIVVRAEHHLRQGAIVYDALCDAFDELAPGEATPTYDILYDDETSQVTWARQ